MRSSNEIKKEIESRFGFFPPFFAPALKTPQILENLWQQTLSAYVENPLPALFKEKFAAIVARSCSVPYCLVCHSCTLRPLGMKADEVLDLLEKWHAPSESEIRASLKLLAGHTFKMDKWPEAGSTFEDAILHISVQLFFGDDETESYSKELCRALGETKYDFLILLIGYNKTCLTWAEAHASELSFEADQRAKEHLGPLLAEEPRLGEFFKNYKEKFSNVAKSKLAKQLSVESETKYKKLVQLSPAGIFQADATGKFVFVSEGWQRVAGLSLEEAVNSGWENAVHPDDKEKIFKEWMSSDAEKRTFKCEYRLRKPSGEITWVNAECEQLRNASGEITGYLGALQDITSLKDYEEKLVLAQLELESRVEERTADLLSLTESIPQLVWKIAPNGESLYMSPNWEDLTGVPSDQAQWEDIIHPEDVPASKSAWLNCLETGSSYETEYRIKLKDGTYRWFLARGVPQLDSDGKVKKWFGTCTDIHDQKIALQSNMRMAAIVESSNDAIISKDLTGTVTSWNPAAEKIFGYRREEMVGKSILKLFPADLAWEEASILDRLQRGIHISHFETERLRKNGTRIPVLLSMSPIYDAKGNVVGVAKIARDITHEKEAHINLIERTKSLVDLQSRFQKVSQATDLGVWYCNLPFDKLIWSDKVKEHFWMDASREVTIEDFYEYLHHDDRERVRQAIAVSIEEHKPYDIEYRTVLPGSSDRWKWIRATGWTEYDSLGKPIQFDGITLDITKQKNAQKIIEEQEQNNRELSNRLQALISNAPISLTVYDKNGIFTYADGKVLSAQGIKSEDIVGKSIFERHRNNPEVLEEVKRALEGKGNTTEIEVGKSTYLASSTPVKDDAGNVTSVIGIAFDITERVLAEKVVHESQSKLDTVLNEAPVILWSTDSDGIITHSEGSGLKSLGFKSGQLVGQSVFELNKNSPEGLPKIRRALAGESFNSEAWSGEVFLETHYSPLKDKNGKIVGMVGFSKDATDRKLAERSAASSESKFKQVCESKLFGMLFWDKNGAINDANDALLNMLGYTRDELDSGLLNWKVLTPPEYADLDANAVAETIAHGYCEPYEKEYIRKGGSRVAIIISGATIQGEANTGGLALIIDVSAKKSAEKEKSESILNERAALHASKMKSDFLANMSHEIRTPINGVIGMMGLLSDTRLLPEQREYADAARSSADALLTVINDILDFSKVEAGKLEFEDIDFDLPHLLKDVAKTFSFPARSKGISLSMDVDPKTPKYVGGDPGRLRQVLNNLVSNALKFTEKGDVSIQVKVESIEKQGSRLRVEIKDTGIGMPEKARSRMFQAFSQADASTTRRFGGTGLGLSICKHLVEKMQGAIGVESTDGQGSTFWFTLSLRSALAPVRSSAGHVGNFKDLSERHFRVLVAEDNPINQKIALRVLEKMGLSADAVANGQEVLDAHRSIPYDLILMDCQMPELDGYETTRMIRASKSLPRTDVPIIAMTANAISGDKERCLSAGMNDYVSKPVKNDELFAVLSRWLLTVNKKPVVINQTKATTDIIDHAVIDELLSLDENGDRSLLEELVGMWLIRTPVIMELLKGALLSNDLQKIAAEAHQLKSTSGHLGAMRISKLSGQIEEAALANGVSNLNILISQLETAVQEAIPELQALSGIPNTSVA